MARPMTRKEPSMTDTLDGMALALRKLARILDQRGDHRPHRRPAPRRPARKAGLPYETRLLPDVIAAIRPRGRW